MIEGPAVPAYVKVGDMLHVGNIRAVRVRVRGIIGFDVLCLDYASAVTALSPRIVTLADGKRYNRGSGYQIGGILCCWLPEEARTE